MNWPPLDQDRQDQHMKTIVSFFNRRAGSVKCANYPSKNPSSVSVVKPRGYAAGKGHHESPVHRNPYESHIYEDAIRTQDADLAVSLFFFK